MQPDVGKIYEGKVTGITKFGAFVEIEPGVTGMVHISEVANTFVNEIKDHLTEGQQVKVKVLSVSEEGKISLSIKKALPAPPKKEFRPREGGRSAGGAGKPRQEKSIPKEPQTPESAFEDMLNRFKASSDERIGDIRKNMDNKRRNTSRRRGG
ncbi:MAG: S1 RNA-binding domain-containing protein [Oscillospiraceae bacterium]|nr:S1 RNA-binding domain-containing protein [Oscillospiraceae bacterium]